MAELYLFDQDDNFIAILSKEEGLVDTWFKDYQNHIPDEPFIFNINSNSELLQHIKEENQVVFYDRDGGLRLVRMKELYEVTTKDGNNIRVKCEPSFLELYDHFIEDKRITNGTAQTALNRALEGSRYIGEVTVDLGLATDNFYWIDGIGAIFKILSTWGGALKDTVTLDVNNEIIERKIWIVQRLGADNGLIVEPDHNAEQIGRKTLSYVETALWGQGSSLETDNGGFTRYITFEDVEWKVSAGDPVDKPLGQKWVGDPQALAEHGYFHNGVRKHKFGHFSNQEYETPEELLMATWNELQERKLKEIIHEATIYESDKKVSLGDTVTILDRNYNKSIELQSQITGLEYDPIFDDKEIVIIIGKYVDMNENPLQKDVDDLKDAVNKPRPTAPINNESFPNTKPSRPTNVTATGAFQTIQLFWDYDSSVYISHYEVYGSQVADFVPDTQHLLYRGRVSAFGHEVDTDEMWYYYVRAVNTRGTASDYSNRVSASSVRIITDDILFGSILAEHLSTNLDIADKLAQNTIDSINAGPMQEIQYTNQEIIDTENRLLGRLNNDIGDVNTSISDLLTRTSGIEGTVTNVVKDINTIDGKLSTTITQLSNIDGVVSDHTLTLNALPGQLSAKAEKNEVYTRTATDTLLGAKVNTSVYNNKMTALDLSISGISGRVSNTETNINNLTGEVSSAKSQIANLDVRADGIVQSVSSVRADLDGLEIGGRNLLLNSDFSRGKTSNWSHLPAVQRDGNILYVSQPYGWNVRFVDIDVVAGETYTFSALARKTGTLAAGLRFSTTAGNLVIPMDGGTAWKRYSGQVTVPSDFTGALSGYILNSHTSGEHIHIALVKVVKGNKDTTDWTPAPEDIDGRITTAEGSINTLAGQVELKASQTSVNSLTGRMSNAETTLNLLPGQLNAKVNKNGVISEINATPESIRIASKLIHLSGTSQIDNAVIGTAAIANLAVTNAKLALLSVGTAQIQNLAVTSAKIQSLNADKINATSLSAISANLGTVTAGRIGTLEIAGITSPVLYFGSASSPNGLINYADNAMRFQRDQWTYYRVNQGGSTGSLGVDSKFLHQFYGAGDNIFNFGLSNTGNTMLTSKNSMLKFSGTYNEVQVRNAVDSAYGDLRLNDINSRYVYARSIYSLYNAGRRMLNDQANGNVSVNAVGGSLYLGYEQTSRIYANATLDTQQNDISTRNIVLDGGTLTGNTTNLIVRTNVSSGIIYLQAHQEARVTTPGAGSYRPIRASGFPTESVASAKQDIKAWDVDILDIYRNEITIYEYQKKDEVAMGIGRLRQGLVIGEGYNTPIGLIDGSGTEQYLMNSWNMKAIQEVIKVTDNHEDRLNILELENQYLKQKIKQLEENAA